MRRLAGREERIVRRLAGRVRRMRRSVAAGVEYFVYLFYLFKYIYIYFMLFILLLPVARLGRGQLLVQRRRRGARGRETKWEPDEHAERRRRGAGGTSPYSDAWAWAL